MAKRGGSAVGDICGVVLVSKVGAVSGAGAAGLTGVGAVLVWSTCSSGGGGGGAYVPVRWRFGSIFYFFLNQRISFPHKFPAFCTL